MINRKKVNIIFVFIVILFIANILFGDSFPPLEVKYDDHIEKLLLSEPDFNKENPTEYKDQWKKIIESLEKVYEEMWEDFNSKGKDILPWCVYEAFNDLKLKHDKKNPIVINLTIQYMKTFPDGRITICSVLGEYFSEKMLTSKWKGIWMFGLWRKWYRESLDSPRYCLKSVVFHEMLHYALDIADRKTGNTYFKIRNIINPRKTTIDNFWSDEGVIQDCELKLFPCGCRGYRDAAENWYDNNARRYERPPDDCHLCKLCKPKPSSSMRALSSNDDECDPECPEGGKGGGGHGPGRDNADDRYSFSEGIVREYNLAPEAVIFTDGYWQDALKLYGGLKFDGDNAAEQLLEATPFLVIPSGGLFGKENDTTLKHVLEQYVSLGGTLVVFAQQYV